MTEISPPTSVQAITLPPALRAEAARRDAAAFRDLSNAVLTDVRVKFSDPLFDAAHQVAQLYRRAADVCEDMALLFDTYAADDLLHGIAS